MNIDSRDGTITIYFLVRSFKNDDVLMHIASNPIFHYQRQRVIWGTELGTRDGVEYGCDVRHKEMRTCNFGDDESL